MLRKLLLSPLLLALAVSGMAQTNLTCTKSGSDVALSWSGGTTPYKVVRSNSPLFYSNALLAQGYTGSSLNDTAALSVPTVYFYDVSGDGEPSQDEANPAQPLPVITSLSPDTGKPGDTIIINGSNFGDSPEKNLVSFGPFLAQVSAATTTQLTVSVPSQALTSLVSVTVGSLTSNAVIFYRKFGAASYSDLSSICFEDGNGSVWVADRATVDKFIEVFPNETQTVRDGIGEVVISDIEVSGTWFYYGNSTYSSANTGIVRRWNVGTNALQVFRTIGVSGSDPVQILAITPDPLTVDRIFVSDGYRHTIRRVPMSGAIDQDYGNMGSVTFNNPAGLRCDSAGNLYATTSNALLRITPGEVVTTLLSGLNGAAGIDITERPGFPIILIAEESTGKVLLYNTQSGIVEIVATGLTQPSGVAFTENLTTGELFYDVIEPTRILRLPDPIIEVKLTAPTSVLIHKYRSEYPYPDPINQTQDGRIKIEVELKGFSSIPSTVYFRAVNPDPDDLSGYEPDTTPGDNRDTTSPPSNKYGDLSATSASVINGKASVDLIVTDRNSGDNYQVQISTNASFSTIDATTAVITAWKRVYIEWDKMYKQGSFVKQESGVSQPPGEKNRIYLLDTSGFAQGDQVHIISGGWQADKTKFNQGETGTIVQPPTADYIVLDHDLTLTYPDSWDDTNAVSQYPHAFAAKTAAGYYTSQLSTAELAKAFNDAYVEFVVLKGSTGNSFLPLWHHLTGTREQRASFIDQRSSVFFQNFVDATPSSYPSVNHVQFVSSAYSDYPVPQPPAGTNLGQTQGSNIYSGGTYAYNWTWTFCNTIDDYTGITDKLLVRWDTDTHEMGHQFNVNYPDGSPNYGHDTRASWKTPTVDQCLMNEENRLREDNFLQFCSVDAYSIRDHTDDLNQDQ